MMKGLDYQEVPWGFYDLVKDYFGIRLNITLLSAPVSPVHPEVAIYFDPHKSHHANWVLTA